MMIRIASSVPAPAARDAAVNPAQGLRALVGMTDAENVVMSVPTVSHYMTCKPRTVSSTNRLHTARTLMHELQIHHLPVIDHDKLVGLVSDRDLSSIVVDDRVADVMTTDVAVVAANAPLDEVIGLMSLGRFSSVVVMGTDGIEGIF